MIIGYTGQYCESCKQSTPHEIHERNGFVVKRCQVCRQRELIHEQTRD